MQVCTGEEYLGECSLQMQTVFKKDAASVCSYEAAETACLPGPGSQQLEIGHPWPGSRKNFSLLQIDILGSPSASCAPLWPQEVQICSDTRAVDTLIRWSGFYTYIDSSAYCQSQGAQAAIQLAAHFPVIPQLFPRFNLTASSALFFRKVLLFLPRHGTEVCSPLAGKLSLMFYLISV